MLPLEVVTVDLPPSHFISSIQFYHTKSLHVLQYIHEPFLWSSFFPPAWQHNLKHSLSNIYPLSLLYPCPNHFSLVSLNFVSRPLSPSCLSDVFMSNVFHCGHSQWKHCICKCSTFSSTSCQAEHDKKFLIFLYIHLSAFDLTFTFQLGIQYLAHGYFGMQTGSATLQAATLWSSHWTTNLLISR